MRVVRLGACIVLFMAAVIPLSTVPGHAAAANQCYLLGELALRSHSRTRHPVGRFLSKGRPDYWHWKLH